ncbi:hypothetical protein POVCU2_0097820 [Plasmodium ovale curtisi]|uniref:Uncharacterized protein n=1 Tax=Plasmodium ovale curtisi TaxID=864141 RepID=A0A1A8XAK3_PLAOA|nr:hypothetical protein POVCU2_0097820 [Plasmodium ovale curtisi]SBT01294.1 hypothetical protein POVCU1_065830 [Plasmodium ovale curtisi]
MPKASRKCQKLPENVKSYQKMPKTTRKCQKKPFQKNFNCVMYSRIRKGFIKLYQTRTSPPNIATIGENCKAKK